MEYTAEQKECFEIINEAQGVLKNNPPHFNLFYRCFSFILPSFFSGSIREYKYITSRIFSYGDKCSHAGDVSGAYRVRRAVEALTLEPRDSLGAMEILDRLRSDGTLFDDGILWGEINWRCRASAFWISIFCFVWFLLKIFDYNNQIVGLAPRAYVVYGIAGCLGYVASWASIFEYDDTKPNNEKHRGYSRPEIIASPLFAFISGCIVYMVIMSKVINIIPSGVKENIAIFLFSFLSGFKGPRGYRIIDKLGKIVK
ncbi:MAG: hypothetical protein LKG97_09780 [Acetobacter peroxydans]|jgi:hypothetical protein|uniref:hypothetical protein n=1 Tax=Acetobacter peroxydans TaxID=104098 RepID=UPI0023535A33|nr:hypothetical protein [Acetobacter peroxydans]MCI1411983.1 hypothetical protein [Acetobacter peroxydans]